MQSFTIPQKFETTGFIALGHSRAELPLLKTTSTTRFVVCKSGLTRLDCNIIQSLINSSFFKDLFEGE